PAGELDALVVRAVPGETGLVGLVPREEIEHPGRDAHGPSVVPRAPWERGRPWNGLARASRGRAPFAGRERWCEGRGARRVGAAARWGRPLAAVGLLVLLAAPGAAVPDEEGLRSELYPTDWQPGLTHGEGRFLHDFSYAGYRYGADVPDAVAGEVYDVTQPPYGVDPD